MSAYNAIPSIPIAVTSEDETVSVTAPATCPSGYTFEVVVNGVVKTVQVPAGGVNKGDEFQAIVVSSGGGGVFSLSDNAPNGRWRDGLCSCCKYGPCHPMFMLALCLPQVLMAQVMTRMKLSWLGNPADLDEWKKTYRNVWLVIVSYFVLKMIFAVPVEVDEDGMVVPKDDEDPRIIVGYVINISYFLYTLYAMAQARKYIRDRYNIPEQRCYGCEDYVCSFCCGCCTIAQMANHTADYDIIRATCCTATGLPDSIDVESYA
eukprot:CAMPEP_0196825438 /NCGR_PEP_ID=MMETSP1362-20130617/93048_1 /TAXON_ID=163516 /ORGANISM="Leptocylindrus danicus, Strain CCMP1856" /LENGTH=261 /DNA_ID=CAMNT_0042205861 /DNA_START=448 /DNA_END=1233 /DNA_ORIENTATION=+